MTLSLDSVRAIQDRGLVRRAVTIAATAALATGAFIAIETGLENASWFVRRLRLKQDSGTAGTWNARIGSSGSFADADAYIQLRADDTELSTATPINESIEQDDGWVVSDATGRVYIKLTFSSAADHVISGSVLLEPAVLVTPI